METEKWVWIGLRSAAGDGLKCKKLNFSSINGLLLLPLTANTATAADCISSLRGLIPCQNFLVNGSPFPSLLCCNGVKDLAKTANKSKAERRFLCKCLKDVAQRFPINERKAKALPRACHANLNIAISPHIDCNKIL
ncbi:hypothetical protein M9H77_13327 [Catharanthus roseus]|uniref:Uncharacterized protein n=1 Tax=Catharanthus roseus TaxID=4058 RepID=A0ACC0BK23_CATRO|nr:hypothetical protein M9H77_13327 [Catharanthus roseus]